MTDSFKNDCDRIQRLLISIRSDINKRDQKKAASLPVAMIEGEIRGQLTNLGDFILISKIVSWIFSKTLSLHRKRIKAKMAYRKRNLKRKETNTLNSWMKRTNLSRSLRVPCNKLEINYLADKELRLVSLQIIMTLKTWTINSFIRHKKILKPNKMLNWIKLMKRYSFIWIGS